MSSSLDYLDLCRLCLVKDHVNVPIFAEGDVRQIFLKITACLPVKVSRDDKLPKKICDDCVYKLETFYQFWNTTANAEKQLLQWLCEVGGLEDKQGYEVLDSNVMKQERGSDNRLDGNVMQVAGHQNNMDMGMIDNMSLITMSTGSDQQFTSVPMDTSGTVQAVPGPSSQSHDVAQSQTGVSHIVEEEEESEEDENSDDGCDNEEGLPVKEENEDQSDQPLEPTQFVSLPCDEAGPSGLQQSKMSEMTIQQTTDGDPKTGSPGTTTSRSRAQHTCDLCHSTFPRFADLVAHLRNLHGIERPVICDVCGRAFRSPWSVGRHKSIHETEKRYACDLCDYACRQKSNLVVHRRRHAKNYSYRCDVCGSGFMQRTKYLEHRTLHEGRGANHKCQVCDKVFNYKRNLVAHVKYCHPETCVTGEPLVECIYCPRAFSREESLKRHLKSSHASLVDSTEKCLCDLCGRQLSSKKALIQHMRGHTGEKIAECDVCGKAFSKWDNLRVHQRIHTGERPYLCSVCGKSFAQRTSLVHHIRLHNEEKNFQCRECDKAFVAASLLRKHAKVHEKC